MKNNLSYVLFFAGLGLLFLVLTMLGRYYWSYRLNRWAADQGCKLIEFRGAKFYEGPHAWIRSDSQHLFHVQVEDRTGRRSTAWVMFGTYWGFTLGVPVKEVTWEDREK